jgi:hypothetical protein
VLARPLFTTVLARVSALSVGILSVAVGGLLLAGEGVAPGGPLRARCATVVMLGGAALCLVTVRPAVRSYGYPWRGACVVG